MRIIDADALKTAFPCGEYVRTESVRATIDSMPTIDAEPVRHGKWIELNTEWSIFTCVDEVKCSECGFVEYFNKGWARFKYCPNCGAKMDEVNDESFN